jgi:hypothetical protein
MKETTVTQWVMRTRSEWRGEAPASVRETEIWETVEEAAIVGRG